MALTDVKVRNAKPGEKQIKLTDGDGMYLLITPSGGKCWRLKYRFEGKEKVLAFGTYPEVSLSEAREKRFAARKQLANGIDPNAVKKAKKAAVETATENCFEVVAREWHEKFKSTWSEEHAGTIMSRLEQNVFPWLGKMTIGDIEAPDVLSVLRRVEERRAFETAHRIKSIFGQVFRYAIATSRVKRDVAADLKGALSPTNEKHHAAVTDPKKVAPLLRAIAGYQGGFIVRSALQFASLVFVRPGELRHAEWSEINLDAAEWNIPAEKMKLKRAHLVPLSRQSVVILLELHHLTGRGRYVFPTVRSAARPMSENTVNAALRGMGYGSDEMTGHGFRAMARTMLDEVLQFRPDFIEHQLAHAVKDPNGRAYNRTAHLAQRREMMQAWADYLDELKVTP
jgi:integrase